MSTLSAFNKNGQTIQVNAGSGAINPGDLIAIGGPGNEAYTVATIDYAIQSAAGAILAPTELVAGALPEGNGSRQPLARDALGNIYVAGTNNYLSELVIYKRSASGSVIASAVLDGAAFNVNGPKLFQLSNANFGCVYARGSGALYFVIFDANLNLIVAPTSVASEYTTSNTVYHDAIALSGGGLAIVYQTSSGGALDLVTYSNAGAIVLAATNIFTITGTAAQGPIRVGQLTNGNLVAVFSNTTLAATSFVIVTTAGVNVTGPVSAISGSVNFIELSVIPGGSSFALAGTTTISGVLRMAVYSQSGSLLGFATQYSSQEPYATLKVINDGLYYYLVNNSGGVNISSVTAAGVTGPAASGLGSSVLNAAGFALDAEIINGEIVVLAASSTTYGQYWLNIGLPDPSLGIGVPYLRTAPTAIGTAASSTGSYWPRVLSGGGGLYAGTGAPNRQPSAPKTSGDWTAIFCWDQQYSGSSSATYLAIQKVEPSAILGLSQSQIAAGNNGILVTINGGPGQYPVNSLAGTSGSTFDHASGSPVGNAGSLFSAGAALDGAMLDQTAGASGQVSYSLPNPPPGYLGVFGTGAWQCFSVSGSFTVPPAITAIRVRVVGAGGSGGSGGGGGGGYAHGVFTVAAGTAYSVTVGVGGGGSTTGTSSFGALISATGGSSPGSSPGSGGSGSGGQFQASGGAGGSGGGGGAGSQLGTGGNGGTGGGGVGGGAGSGSGGGSPFGSSVGAFGGPDAAGSRAGASANGVVNATGATVRFPFDGFPGGGGGSSATVGGSAVGGSGGIGGGGGAGLGSGSSSSSSGTGGTGGTGGGGGYATATGNGVATGGVGGIGGGGGGGGGSGSASPGVGGGGIVIVEW